MSASAIDAWYRGRHTSTNPGDDSLPWNIAMLAVAILTMIAAYGAWLHPMPPDESGPGPSKSVGVSPQPKPSEAVSFALSQIGSPYVWGATGPFKDGYDASGLVMAAWRHAGVSIPRTIFEEWAKLPHVSRADLKSGDLVFFDGFGHVAMYIGHNEIIESPYYGQDVRVASLSSNAYQLDGAARP